MDPVSDLIRVIGLQKFIEESEGYIYIKNTQSFLVTDKNIERAFKHVLKRPQFLDQLFKVDFVNIRNTINGDIGILSIRDSPHLTSPSILIKVPKVSNLIDPISNEYYIGLTLNEIRRFNEYVSFAFLYGITYCNNRLNDRLIYDDRTDRNKLDKDDTNSPVVFYEYLTVDSIPLSLADFIGRFNPIVNGVVNTDLLQDFEDTLISIIKYTLLSLQFAQSVYGFTHYDLHLNNVMLQEISQPTTFTFKIGNRTKKVTLKRFIPVIIDFGRSYINPSEITPGDENKGAFVDLITQKEYATFKELSYKMWTNVSFYHTNPNLIENIKIYVDELIATNSYFKDLSKEFILRNFYRLKFRKRRESVPSGINPLKSNTMFDTFRFVKSLCALLYTDRVTLNPIWDKLSLLLSQNYPIFIPKYFELPQVYEPYNSQFNYKVKYPIDIIEFIDYFYVNQKMQIDTQIGGGSASDRKLNSEIEIPLSNTVIEHTEVNLRNLKETGNLPLQSPSIYDKLVINDKPTFDQEISPGVIETSLNISLLESLSSKFDTSKKSPFF
jgi:hypothetical protein